MSEPPGWQQPTSARAWLDYLFDAAWTEHFADIVGGDPLMFPGYPEQLEAARAATGEPEAVLVGEGTIPHGSRMIVIAFEFGFLGGSMGVAAGERICRAFEFAAAERVPVLALVASGGARMQEGMLALAQLPATMTARRALADARQPFIAYLRDPTTGGVYASFASSADLIWAEPGATIGFAGPRVAEAVTGESLPEGSHTALFALRAGLIDQLLEPGKLKGFASLAPSHMRPLPTDPSAPPPARPSLGEGRSAWEQVEEARSREARGFSLQPAVLAMRRASALHLGFAFHAAWNAVVISPAGSVPPAGYRAARHAIAVATRLGLPIVTYVATPGADPSSGSERDGIAREISATLDALMAAPVPTVAVVVGEGGSGGALALAACDRVLAMERSVFSVIAPEGAASILRRTDIEQVAEDLRLTARDLHAFGLCDALIAELPGEDPAGAQERIAAAVAWALADIEVEGGAPTRRRLERWRVWDRA